MQLSPMVISCAALIRTPGQIKQQLPIVIFPCPAKFDHTVNRTRLSGAAMTWA